MKIYKYKLTLDPEQVIYPDAIAKSICVQIQNGVPCLWAQLEANRRIYGQTASTRIKIYCVMTGEEIEYQNTKYLSTIQHDGIVAHFYVNDELFYK